MTDQSDILSGSSTPAAADIVAAATAAATPTQVQQPSYMDQLQSIKNDEGLQKYASVEDALTGTAHAQQFIQTLKDEKALLLSQLEEAKTNQYAQAEPAQYTTEPGLGVDDVYSLMKDYEQNKVHESNRKSVGDTLVNHCNGDRAKAEEVLANRLTELNMSRDHLNTLAASSPSAVYELLGLTTKGPSSNYSSGTINTEAVDATKNKEVQRAKALPIGASTDHLVAAWRDAIAEVN